MRLDVGSASLAEWSNDEEEVDLKENRVSSPLAVEGRRGSFDVRLGLSRVVDVK